MIPTNNDKEEIIQQLISFISEIGIGVHESEIPQNSFFPGIEIRDGELFIDKFLIKHPGDLLHEAGHIAVAPVEDRKTLSGNVKDTRPGTEGEEICVMLWTWAACKHLSLNPSIVFHKDGYKGDSEWIIENYTEGNYLGLPLLVWMGMTTDPKEENGFPLMKSWLRQ